MPITTYAELQSSIADFLDRDDLTSVIPTFISLAEADMNRQIRHWRQEKRATANIDTQYSAVPSDFYEVIRMYITSGNTQPLELLSQFQLLERKRRTANATYEPRYYAITAGEIEVSPFPMAHIRRSCITTPRSTRCPIATRPTGCWNTSPTPTYTAR